MKQLETFFFTIDLSRHHRVYYHLRYFHFLVIIDLHLVGFLLHLVVVDFIIQAIITAVIEMMMQQLTLEGQPLHLQIQSRIDS
jgi:hypothetical protein